jgi:Lamin Tail Domain
VKPSRSRVIPFVGALVLALVGFAVLSSPIGNPNEADATSCVRVVGGVINPAGNENYMPYLDNEYVLIRNYCSTYKTLTGWRVHDYGSKHTYHFPTGFKIYPGYYVKLHSGTGTNGKYNLYWQRTYGAVWNNTPPERAYLLNQYGTLVSSWSPY